MMVYYENERIEIPEGCSGASLADKLNLKNPEQALALKLNGKMVDLQTALHEGDRVGFVNFEEKEGKEIFWHTSAHVLAQAILRLFPDAKPTIGPPIEAGFYYDFANLQISESDFEAIEKEALEIIKENFKPKRIVFENKKEALESFSKNPYKQELIESFEKGEISAYEQGEFFDLCRGPHLPALSKIKAFKILKTSGAYWRGDNSREMLTRVYAISFPDRKQLKDYLHMIEEAKKRDHRVIGNKLDLFSFLEEAPGMPFIHPKGIIIWNALLHFLRELQSAGDYVEIKTPQIMNRTLWEKSGHWHHYKENMYAFPIDEQEFAIKPMNCPGCMLYYKSQSHSYRELPLRVSEIGHVFRHELSGALNGLFRVRSFHQDDAHHFMKPEDIKDEIIGILNLTKKIYHTFGLSFFLELSTRPEKEKTIGSDEDWELSTSSLKAALEEFGMPFKINEGDGAFYGPKIDIHIKDALGRSWQCGTVQLDMALPQRFELKYTGNDGQEKRPLMLHRAIFGSIERFFGILIEHFAGKFPLWLSPRQVRIVPVADRHVDYAQSLQKKIIEAGLLCEIDDTSESVSKKIRNAQIHQVNYMLTIGDKEVENGTINLRTRDNVVHGELDLNTFIEKITKERDHRDLTSPFSPSGAS